MRHIPMSAVDEAATAIYSAVVRTPLVRLPVPVTTADGQPVEVYLKLECLQPIGSFKLRGAVNAVRQLTPTELAGGVWTVSAGNAAQGVAAHTSTGSIARVPQRIERRSTARSAAPPRTRSRRPAPSRPPGGQCLPRARRRRRG